jgi:hypothetical protein
VATGATPASAEGGAPRVTHAAALPRGHWGLVAVTWTLVAVPLGWGVYHTLALVSQLFRR